MFKRYLCLRGGGNREVSVINSVARSLLPVIPEKLESRCNMGSRSGGKALGKMTSTGLAGLRILPIINAERMISRILIRAKEDEHEEEKKKVVLKKILGDSSRVLPVQTLDLMGEARLRRIPRVLR